MSHKRIAVYLGATLPQDPSYADAVRQLGEAIAARGWSLVFGGSREGTMTILADAVLHHGGRAVGVFTRRLPPEFLYPGLTETHVTDDLAQRKAMMLEMADAIVALPGSYGTWDELCDALEWAKIEVIHGRAAKPIVVLNISGFYDGLLELLRRSVQEGYTTAQYAGLLQSAATVSELLELLERQ